MKEDWKENFNQLVVQCKFLDAENLFKENSPKTLIKFQGTESYYLDSLKSNKIWFSSPTSFNDPFDCFINMGNKEDIDFQLNQMLSKVTFDKRMDDSQIDKFIVDRRKLILDKILKNMNKVCVSCLSDENNLLKNIMWAHYADCHKGFCIKYSFDDLFKKYSQLWPVLYKNEINLFREDLFFSSNAPGLMLYYANLYTCVKSKEWEYENEWRIVIPDNEENKKGFLKDICKPIAVYLGCKSSEDLKREMKEICKDKKIKLYQMKMKPNSFELIYEEVDIN